MIIVVDGGRLDKQLLPFLYDCDILMGRLDCVG